MPSGAEPPDTRAETARLLLHHIAPLEPVIEDMCHAAYGASREGAAMRDELYRDPRYLIGRLQQALTALMALDLPPLDATAQLLQEALDDAVRYRESRALGCGCEEGCPRCIPDLTRADAYEGLYGCLGLTADGPPSPLTVVRDGAR